MRRPLTRDGTRRTQWGLSPPAHGSTGSACTRSSVAASNRVTSSRWPETTTLQPVRLSRSKSSISNASPKRLAYVTGVRRERGFGVNPWDTHTRFLVSQRLLIDHDETVPRAGT